MQAAAAKVAQPPSGKLETDEKAQRGEVAAGSGTSAEEKPKPGSSEETPGTAPAPLGVAAPAPTAPGPELGNNEKRDAEEPFSVTAQGAASSHVAISQ